ncbi:ATP-binding protein [Yoonia sp. BS5-3]|uniref:histidine kinase n=1 Tax=Yoonia phaeophyticola TaxID=3137369 RepID=A0ABZ2V4E7_9RHOB
MLFCQVLTLGILGTPVAAQERQTSLNGGLLPGMAIVLILLLLGLLYWQRQRYRVRVVALEKRHASREHALKQQVDKLTEDLAQSHRELDEFAHIASHDLKEPLRGISINANFLLREELPPKARERALRMNELSGRMQQLISDLLFFSRLGHNDGPSDLVEPHQVIDTIRNELSGWLAERGGEIIETGPIPTLLAARVDVKTILQNLILNGIKYNENAQKHVEIGFVSSVEINGQTLKDAIFVRDNGIGVSDQHHEKVFQIFSRLNKREDYRFLADEDPGTGSGLAFVRKIVAQYGGIVDFTSELGTGSTFYVTLPLAPEAA